MEVPKRKPKTQNKTKQQMGEQLALLELRAELDPYLKDNPLARLGFDMIERGEQIGDERSGGEILAGIVGGKEGFDAYGIRKTYRGFLGPSDRYKESVDPNDPRPLMTVEDFKEKTPLTFQVLEKQGIASLLSPEKGSTVYYDTGDDELPRGGDLSVLLEELAHLGMRKLQTDKGEFTDMPLRREEYLMDLMQGRAEAKSGVYSEGINKDKYLMNASKLEGVDQAALRELGMRGVPVQVRQKQKTMGEKLMGLFGG